MHSNISSLSDFLPTEVTAGHWVAFPVLHLGFPLFVLSVVSLVHIWNRLLLFCCSVVSDSFSTSWTVAHQAPLSMGSSRREHWSGLPFPLPGNPPDPGNQSHLSLLHWQVDSLPLSHQGSPLRLVKYLNAIINTQDTGTIQLTVHSNS